MHISAKIGTWESRYGCCSSDLTTKGCCVAECHVTDALRSSELKNFIHTPQETNQYDNRSGKVSIIQNFSG